MGCGVSKLEAPNSKPTTARLRPNFHRRFQDIKRRRHARSLKKTTPSKIVMLRHGPDEDDTLHRNPPFNHLQKSTYSLEAGVMSEGSKISSTLKVNERIIQTASLKETFKGKVRNERAEKAKDQNAEDGSWDESNDERRIGHDKGVSPGSPSFRIYYSENVDDYKNESDNEDQQA